ncbi:MAG: DUF3006 domain-containing protein [Clostridiales bacterium]|nr:DUF3006 domain-containing protein [Clostridiales bacterium]
MRYVIDRIEGGFALCEDSRRQITKLDRARLPAGAGEGSLLEIDADGGVTLAGNPELKTRLGRKMERLFNR